MAICVVAIHTNPLVKCTNQAILAIYNTVISLAVPFFFISSGFLIEEKIKRSGSRDNSISIIWRHTVKTIKMYAIWSLIYLPLAIYKYIESQESLIRGCLLYVRGFFFIGEHYNSWMLWYLLSTIYACCFIILCLKMHFSDRAILIIGTCITIFGACITLFVSSDSQLPNLLNIIKLLIKCTINDGRILTGMFYIPCGMMLSRIEFNLSKSMRIILFVVVSVLATVFQSNLVFSLLIMLDSVIFFETVKCIKFIPSHVYPYLRYMSKIIYFTHMYVWTMYYFIVYKGKTMGVDSFFVTLIICIIISCVLILMNRKREETTKRNAVIHK